MTGVLDVSAARVRQSHIFERQSGWLHRNEVAA